MSKLEHAIAGAKRAGIGFFGGLSYPFRGIGFVYFKHPRLVKYWIWPVLITFALAGLVTYLVATTMPDGIEALMGTSAQPTNIVERLFGGFRRALVIAVTLIAVLASLWGIALLVPVLAAPFNDALSEEVELIRIGKEPPPFSFTRLASEIVRTVRIELAKLALYLTIMVPLFAASFLLPGLGAALYSVFGIVFTAMYYAIDYIDWPASRRGLGIRDRAALARAHVPVMLGFGLSVWVLVFVPFVNLFLIPAAVAGGTMLYIDLARLGSVPE